MASYVGLFFGVWVFFFFHDERETFWNRCFGATWAAGQVCLFTLVCTQGRP